jgi:small subunit ribosomal protein S7
MMYGGKKSTAADPVQVMDIIQKKTQTTREAFQKSVENIKPVLEVKSRRVGGSTYQVPVEVNPAGAPRWRSAGS